MPIISYFPSGSMSDEVIIPEGLPELGREGGLEAYSWAEIAAVSAAGLGSAYWAIGDMKSVALKGTVGTLALDTTLYVYIIGFNHNRFMEGEGISFGTFKNENGKSVCLIDTKYGSSATDGTKYFNMNHWGNSNLGGWAACDLRYDILGSTDRQPVGYGAIKDDTSEGYDASATTATNPVANTLMAALPAELRAVMKPITKYTDNIGNKDNTIDDLSSTVDYLPLLSEFEIFGRRTYANQFEHSWQEQYEYYKAGNDRIKYRHSNANSAAIWWERSPYYSNATYFCTVLTGGDANYSNANFAYGLAPAFKI